MNAKRLKRMLSHVELSVWAVVVIALSSFALLRYSDELWRDSICETMPARDNVAQARAYLAKGYLFLEKRIAGDETIRTPDVFQLFEQAQQAIRNITAGRSAISGLTALPPTDPELLEQLERFQVAAEQFRDLSEERWKNRGEPDALALEQRSAFYELERLASYVDYLADQHIRETLARQRRIHTLTLGLWTMALVGVCLALLWTSSRRRRAEDALQRAYAELEIQVEDQTIELAQAIRKLLAEIAERKRAEEQIKASLEEKKVLLRELYHRTKNNMQVICAMLHFQALNSQDGRAASTFKEIENKIQSMSLVHQKLYQSRQLSNINLKVYISDLAELLMESYQISPDKISLVLDADDVFILIDTAIPCGLILNELISNSLKHAFPGDRKGVIRIQLTRTAGDEIMLRVADDGIGVPRGFDPSTSDTLGLRTVFGIGKHQLQGKVTFEKGNGTTWQIRFRDELYSPRV